MDSLTKELPHLSSQVQWTSSESIRSYPLQKGDQEYFPEELNVIYMNRKQLA
jgi:hypothetical protein